MRFEEQNEAANQAIYSNLQHRHPHGFGVISGGEVTINTGNLDQSDTLSLEASDVLVAGTEYSLSSQSIQINSTDTNTRRDIIYVDSNGDLQVIEGTEQEPQTTVSNPEYVDYLFPTPPDLAHVDATVLYEVWIPDGNTTISSDELLDRRESAEVITHTITTDRTTASSQLKNPVYADDTNAPNETLYFNSNGSELKYKDSGGNVFAASGLQDGDDFDGQGSSDFSNLKSLGVENADITGETLIRAYRGTAATGVSSGSWTDIADTETSDSETEQDSSFNINVNEDGLYKIYAHVNIFDSTSGDTIEFRVQNTTDGTSVRTTMPMGVMGASQDYKDISAIFDLTAGKDYKLQVRNRSSSYSLNSGEDNTYYWMERQVVHP